MLDIDGLKRPELEFDEKKHTRYVQSSESFYLKLKKGKNKLVRYEVQEPYVHRLSYQNLYAFDVG